MTFLSFFFPPFYKFVFPVLAEICFYDFQLVVEEMNIMTTVFLRYDNLKIYFPNSILATKPISNYYRSPDMGDAIDFCVHVATPVEKLAVMKERILK